jgi:hypothetical protein
MEIGIIFGMLIFSRAFFIVYRNSFISNMVSLFLGKTFKLNRMKKTILLIAILFTSFSFLAAQDNTDAEKEAIKKVIQSAYVDGLQNNGDLEAVDAGFHPAFQLIGIGRGESMWSYPIYNWKDDVKRGKEAGKFPKKEEEKVTVKFPMIDVSGTAAVAKLEFYVGQKLVYIDYMSLYKFEDNWKIVNKIFYKLPETDKQ